MLEAIDGAGHEAVDLGTDTDAVRIDYPDKARELGDGDPSRRGRARRPRLRLRRRRVGRRLQDPGHPRRDLPRHYSAHQGVEHDDMNVLCLGSEIVGAELARELVRAFLGARFVGGERYVDRLEKVAAMERR